MSYPPPPPESGGYGEQPDGAGQPGGYGYPPPPPPGQYGGGYGPPPGSGPTSTKAVWALVLGILGLPLALCCSVLGLVGIASILLGRSARREIAASGGSQRGEGMAKAGYILGWVDVVLAVLFMILTAVLFANGDGAFYYNRSS